MGADVTVTLGVFEPEFDPVFELAFDHAVVPALPLAAFGSEFAVPAGAFAGAGGGCWGDGGIVGAFVAGGGMGAIGAVASRRAAKG